MSGIQDIPLKTFEAISPCAIILLIDSPEAIADRLSNRDSLIHSIELITELQAQERERASLISQSLKIPISVIEVTASLEASIEKVSLYL